MHQSPNKKLLTCAHLMPRVWETSNSARQQPVIILQLCYNSLTTTTLKRQISFSTFSFGSKKNTTRTGKTCTNFYDMHINQCLTCTSFPNYTTPQLHFKLHFTPDSCYYYKDRLGQSNKQILRSDD